jgi:hypothetical protein
MTFFHATVDVSYKCKLFDKSYNGKVSAPCELLKYDNVFDTEITITIFILNYNYNFYFKLQLQF